MKITLSCVFTAATLVRQGACSLGYKLQVSNLVSWPVQPDTVPTCSRWIRATQGDDCKVLAKIEHVPLEDFLKWNPSLARDCNAVIVGYGYCSEVKSGVSTTKVRTTTITTIGITYPPARTGNITKTTSFQATHYSNSTMKLPSSGPASTPCTTTTRMPRTTLDPDMFPTASGTVQCVKEFSPIPSPTLIVVGAALDSAIVSACNGLLTTNSKFLETGDPYKVSIPVGGKPTTFLLQIKIGGSTVRNAFCVAQLRMVQDQCTLGGNTFGGCTYTSDFNLLSCILPGG